MTKPVQVLIFALPLVSLAWGDTLTIRNGSHMSGRLISAQGGAIIIAVEGGERRFDVDRIAQIDFTGPGDEPGLVNGDSFGDDEHFQYDRSRNRPDLSHPAASSRSHQRRDAGHEQAWRGTGTADFGGADQSGRPGSFGCLSECDRLLEPSSRRR
jgi:hypothetical protein